MGSQRVGQNWVTLSHTNWATSSYTQTHTYTYVFQTWCEDSSSDLCVSSILEGGLPPHVFMWRGRKIAFPSLCSQESLRMEMTRPCQAEMGCGHKGRAWGLGLGFLSCCLQGGSLEVEAGWAERLGPGGGGGWRAFSTSRLVHSCSHPLRSQGTRKVEAWPLPLFSPRPLCRKEGLTSPSAVWLLRGQCLALWGRGFLILFGF